MSERAIVAAGVVSIPFGVAIASTHGWVSIMLTAIFVVLWAIGCIKIAWPWYKAIYQAFLDGRKKV